MAVQWTQTKRRTGAGGPAAGPAGSGGIDQASRCTKKLEIVQTGHVLVLWLISTHGLSYKAARMGAVIQMVEAIIYQENLLELGLPCHHVRQTHSIGFNTVVRNVFAPTTKCKEGSRSVNCDSLPVPCIALIAWLLQTRD